MSGYGLINKDSAYRRWAHLHAVEKTQMYGGWSHRYYVAETATEFDRSELTLRGWQDIKI